MTGIQSTVTVFDHPMEAMSQAQILLGALFTPSLAQHMVQCATDETVHTDIARALLQRAASLMRDTNETMNTNRSDVPPEQQDLYDHRQPEIMTAIDMAALITKDLPIPTAEPAPLTDEYVPQSPNDYWQWLQAHMQTMPLIEWLEQTQQHMADYPMLKPTQPELLAALTHTMFAMRHAVEQCAESPDNIPADGVTAEDLAGMRQAAAATLDEADTLLAGFVKKYNDSATITMSAGVRNHASISRATLDTPFAPNTSRTIVAPDNDPDGPAIALVYPINREIRSHMLLEYPEEDVPQRITILLTAMAMRHLALQLEQYDVEPSETVRIHSASALHQASSAIMTLTPDVMSALIQESRHRQVPDSAIKDAVHAACSHFPTASNFILSNTDLTPQRCSTEVIQAIAQVLTSPEQDHLVNHIATQMHAPTHLLNLPRAIVAPQHLERIAATARRLGVPEHRIHAYLARTDDGSADDFNPPPPYHDYYTPPADIHSPPTDHTAPLMCSCPWCESYQQRYDNNARDALTLAIRHSGQANACTNIIALHRNAPEELHLPILDVLNDVTSRLGHAVALLQPHTGNPLNGIIGETLRIIQELYQHIQLWEQDSNLTDEDDPVRTAARITIMTMHCNDTALFHRACHSCPTRQHRTQRPPPPRHAPGLRHSQCLP